MTETLLKNDLTAYGLRRVHVLSDRKVARERWLGLAPVGAEGSMNAWEYQEEGVGFWHLWLVWHAWGEVVRMCQGDRQATGVLWYVEEGERMSEVIQQAAERFLAWFDRWPRQAWVETLPKGAPGEMRIQESEGVRDPVIRIQAATWVPKRCVFVTDEGAENG